MLFLATQGPFLRRMILLAFGLAVLLMAFRRLRRYRLKERYTLLFVFTGLPFFALAVWPSSVGWLALKLDIQYNTVALLCVAAFLILMVFELLTIVSLQDRKIATLAQIVGIMMEKHGMSDRNIPKSPTVSRPMMPEDTAAAISSATQPVER